MTFFFLQEEPWAISVVFGCAAAVAALVVIPLWETMNTHLPDTLADLEGYNNPALKLDDEAGVPHQPKG